MRPRSHEDTIRGGRVADPYDFEVAPSGSPADRRNLDLRIAANGAQQPLEVR